MAERVISLRGVEVHNLKSVDLDLPQRRLIVFCGVSGSGKSSLAFDTLYAEGQRRYIESFSAYTRQFLERLEKPAAQRIDGIPAAIAVAAQAGSGSNRSTVATATETYDYLRLLFAKIGQVFCVNCGREVTRSAPQTVADELQALPTGTKYLVTFAQAAPDGIDGGERARRLVEAGYIRVVAGEQIVDLSATSSIAATADGATWHVIVDRLSAGTANEERIRESLESAFEKGNGQAVLFVEAQSGAKTLPPPGEGGSRSEPHEGRAANSTQPSSISEPDNDSALTAAPGTLSVRGEREKDNRAPHPSPGYPLGPKGEGETARSLVQIDGRLWRRFSRSTRWMCDDCGLEYPEPEPRLFSFNSPLGACPTCEGFGNVVDVDMDLVVPDKQKSIREGAIAPWNTPAYAHERDELLAIAKEYDVPVDVPFAELTEAQRRVVIEGVPECEFGGLNGFFNWLERRKYKMPIRVFLSRWRSYRVCPACHGARLRPEALATRVGGRNIAEICALSVDQAIAFFRDMKLSEWQQTVARTMLDQTRARIGFLQAVGLGYLTLDRRLRTLSGGESQRVSLTSALGSNLVNMLYVLDEPSVGLHPQDTDRLIRAIAGLRDRGNTVVVVEHEEAMIRAADMVVEIGPSAGERGGRVVFQGTPKEIEASTDSLTGDYLSGRRVFHTPDRRRQPDHGWLRLAGARGNNLQNLTVEFPLGVLCVVTGVSGAGKSTLVEDTLYPALCRRMKKEAEAPCPFDDIYGDGQINDVLLVDQSPIGRSPRSNPVTYIKAFDEIRAVFADTVDARTRNYTASHFSFNVEGGRCTTCNGDGYIQIDMQFLADVYMKCGQCNGRRYKPEILDVTYRGRNIADVLDMTVREAFGFFRGSTKVQAALKKLIDVGLDYLRLGQPANTLSGGESQRLKLAGYMSAARRARTLFILDEPTTGLHFFDVVQLLDCFDALLAVGHSLIVVEHNVQVMKAADYIIDLGPGASAEGGRVVASGTPEFVSRVPESITGRYLAQALARDSKGKTA